MECNLTLTVLLLLTVIAGVVSSFVEASAVEYSLVRIDLPSFLSQTRQNVILAICNYTFDATPATIPSKSVTGTDSTETSSSDGRQIDVESEEGVALMEKK
jgi:hypothetical protein